MNFVRRGVQGKFSHKTRAFLGRPEELRCEAVNFTLEALVDSPFDIGQACSHLFDHLLPTC
jgi:hypothetical protein